MRFHSVVFHKRWMIPEYLLVFGLEHPCFPAAPSATGCPSPPPLTSVIAAEAQDRLHQGTCQRPSSGCEEAPNLRGDANYLSHNSSSPHPHNHTPALGGVVAVVPEPPRRLAVTQVDPIGCFGSRPPVYEGTDSEPETLSLLQQVLCVHVLECTF